MKSLRFLSAAAALAVSLSSIPMASASTADIARPMTRGEFIFYVMSKLTPSDPTIPDSNCFALMSASVPPTFNLLFSDVSIDSSNAVAICRAMRSGLVSGYSDGSFRGSENISVAEAAKIMVKAFSLLPDATASLSDVWYQPYFDELTAAGLDESVLADPTATVSTDWASTFYSTLRK